MGDEEDSKFKKVAVGSLDWVSLISGPVYTGMNII
jgi:hypothetical protein